MIYKGYINFEQMKTQKDFENYLKNFLAANGEPYTGRIFISKKGAKNNICLSFDSRQIASKTLRLFRNLNFNSWLGSNKKYRVYIKQKDAATLFKMLSTNQVRNKFKSKSNIMKMNNSDEFMHSYKKKRISRNSRNSYDKKSKDYVLKNNNVNGLKEFFRNSLRNILQLLKSMNTNFPRAKSNYVMNKIGAPIEDFCCATSKGFIKPSYTLRRLGVDRLANNDITRALVEPKTWITTRDLLVQRLPIRFKEHYREDLFTRQKVTKKF